MRSPTVAPCGRRRWLLALVALAPLLGGCATLRATMNGWSEDASGLSHAQRTLRAALEDADYPVVLGWKEDDALLHALTGGISAFYAAQYTRSAGLLDTATLLADARLTTSVSRAALTLVTNDLARAYEPRRTELLFVPYYAMLSYVQLDQWEDAAVEARRLSARLAQHGRDAESGERALHAMMHYLAGAVFERAGEQGAAMVAYRNARALQPSFGEAGRHLPDGTGEVLVIVERGFVAHRVTETIHLALGSTPCEEERGRCARRHPHGGDLVADASTPSPPPASAAALPAFRQRGVVAAPAQPHPDTSSRVPRWLRSPERDDDEPHDVRIAFPALHRSPHPVGDALTLVLDGMPQASVSGKVDMVADVDDATATDERRERSAVIARELGRATARAVITKAVQDKTGDVGGHLAELGAVLLTRADVRSWHLLPREVVAMRIRLPAGQHALSLATPAGAKVTGMGPVIVTAGGLTIVPARVWRESALQRRPACAPSRSCEP